jgi:hypothetical protein
MIAIDTRIRATGSRAFHAGVLDLLDDGISLNSIFIVRLEPELEPRMANGGRPCNRGPALS